MRTHRIRIPTRWVTLSVIFAAILALLVAVGVRDHLSIIKSPRPGWTSLPRKGVMNKQRPRQLASSEKCFVPCSWSFARNGSLPTWGERRG